MSEILLGGVYSTALGDWARAESETQSTLSRIWTQDIDSISYLNNR